MRKIMILVETMGRRAEISSMVGEPSLVPGKGDEEATGDTRVIVLTDEIQP